MLRVWDARNVAGWPRGKLQSIEFQVRALQGGIGHLIVEEFEYKKQIV